MNAVTNYRLISMLSPLAKVPVFEKCLHEQLYSYLIKHNILKPHQFEYKQNCSTAHAVCVTIVQYN